MFALTGCGTGFGAETNKQYDAAVGSNHRGGAVDVLNALFVDNADGTATLSAALLNKDASGHILRSVSITGADRTPLAFTMTAPHELSPQTIYSPGKDGDIIMTGSFPAGGFVKITFTFEDVAAVTVDAPVVTRTAMYDPVAKVSAVPKTGAGG